MKRIFSLVILIILCGNLIAQNGNGSSGSPFWGTITSTVQWSTGDPNYGSTVYVGTLSNPDITIGNSGHLTIDPGITVIFTELSSDMIITGSGILNADGTSADSIYFTKASGKSHWGHITFETPGSGSPISGTGTFSFCRVEYGYAATSGTDPSNAGGGIQVNATGVTINNCLFKYNYSNFGGAITVNDGRNTTIKNCRFRSNSSNEAGGAVLLWTNTTALVENCLFELNHSSATSTPVYSGGAIWLYGNTSKIVNCTFVNNTSDQSGDAIYSLSSTGSVILNSIFCGSNDQYANDGTSYIISNCAFETTKPSSAVNTIILDATNGGNGPNFTDPATYNYSIKFVSPCRDAGINTYTGVTIPSTDYINNPTIGTKDIGAYEVQYSRWKTDAGSTDWATVANWDGGVPNSSRDIIIPTGATNYPVSTSAPDVTIGSDKSFIMEPGAKATVGTLTNNGSVLLESDASAISSLITASYSGNNADIQLYLTGGLGNPSYRWHLISSPFTSLNVAPITSVTPNLAQWVESMASADLSIGWVAYNGYIYVSGGTGGPTFSNLDKGKGYNHYYSSNYTYTLSGQLNTTDAVCSLPYTVTDPEQPTRYGLNVLGNPFSSGLDWQAITFGAYSSSFPANTSKVLHYRREGSAVYFINGSGSAPGVTGIIPPMQGFFTKTYSTANSITLPAGARTNGAIPSRYKGESVIPHLMLNLNSSDFNDYTVVRFDYEAKSGLDYDFDAEKREIATTKPYLYTLADDVKYAINGQPFPADLIEIPLTVNLTQPGNHTLNSVELEGLDSYSVFLKDNTTGFLADLKSSPVYSFSSPSGIISGRFTLIFSSMTTAIESPVLTNSAFNIYQSAGSINIQALNDGWDGLTGSIRIFDLSGRQVYDKQPVEFWKNSVIQIQSPSAKGFYMVEITSGIKKYVGKIILN